MNYTVNEYCDEKGRSLYDEWLGSLRDARAKAKIISAVDRMELGNLGDSEPVGEGVSELRIHYGPGYRIYYARDGKNDIPHPLRGRQEHAEEGY